MVKKTKPTRGSVASRIVSIAKFCWKNESFFKVLKQFYTIMNISQNNLSASNNDLWKHSYKTSLRNHSSSRYKAERDQIYHLDTD